MSSRTTLIGAALAMLVATATLAAACDDTSTAVKEPAPGTVDSGGGPGIDGAVPGLDGGQVGNDGGPGDCVMNPKTHEEIINGCTNAVKITKNPTLPLLLADGGLPPLP
ncbi:MAG: hypothetical protein JWP87_1497 [Labilithrix sp.]|nr:hypothetical protein [Labilithrix sp.]